MEDVVDGGVGEFRIGGLALLGGRKLVGAEVVVYRLVLALPVFSLGRRLPERPWLLPLCTADLGQVFEAADLDTGTFPLRLRAEGVGEGFGGGKVGTVEL